MDNATRLDSAVTGVFVTTRWDVIAACKEADELRAKEALAEICQAYWQPVYLCIRHHGHSVHDAQDLAQDFFLQLLKKTWLERLDESKGRFRAYLSVALRRFLCSQWRRRWTLRRGRGSTHISIEAAGAEKIYEEHFSTQTTPETLYERQWAKTVIDRSLEQLTIELRAKRMEFFLEHLDAILLGDSHKVPYHETAESLGWTAGALRSALFRWRQRFHTLMREEVARTVVSKAEIDDELQHLQQVIARTE